MLLSRMPQRTRSTRSPTLLPYTTLFRSSIPQNQPQQVSIEEAICPHCGTGNEFGALFCENCGGTLQSNVCPNCKHPVDSLADYCEHCKTYISKDHCSFCNASISKNDVFCPDCGSSLAGINCPICHTMNQFSYCKICGTPLTTNAQQEQQAVYQGKTWKRMSSLVTELEQLMYIRPIETPIQLERNEQNEELRRRVLSLLDESYEPTATLRAPMTFESLQEKITHKRKELQALFDKTQVEAQESAVLARNFAMARKPATTLLGWKCNYKHVVHTSPCGCSCPQMGGKWIILNGDTKVEDDV